MSSDDGKKKGSTTRKNTGSTPAKKTVTKTTGSKPATSKSAGKGNSGRKGKDDTERTVKGQHIKKVVKQKRVLTKEEQSVRNEIILTITALVSVLMILSYLNICGVVGRMINTLLFGMMGAIAYVFPLILFFFTAFFISNHGNRLARNKMLGGLALFILTTALFQICTGLQPGMNNPFDYYNYCAEHRSGGGVFGAVIAVPFNLLFGRIATIVIIIAFMIVFLMVLTGKALFALIRRFSVRQYELSKERFEARREYFEEVEQEEIKNSHHTLQYVTLNGENQPATETKEETKPSFLESIMDRGSSDSARTREMREIKAKEEELDANGNVIGKGKTEKAKKPLQQTNHIDENVNEKGKASFPSYTVKGNIIDDIPAPTEVVEITPARPQSQSFVTDNFDNFRADTTGMFEEPKENKAPANKYTNSAVDKLVSERNITSRPAGETVSAGAKAVMDAEVEKTAAEKANDKPAVTKEKLDAGTQNDVSAEIAANLQAPVELPKKYVFPTIDLLNLGKGGNGAVSRKEVDKNAETLTRTLESFGVHVKLLNVSCGPTVTRYELQPEQGVKVASITKLENDIKLNLAAADIRIEAPIPGKAAIGIEVPNKENSTICIRDMLESNEFKTQNSGIAFAVGKDITGNSVVTDISKMPHLLIAGATGSGKSVCINTLIMSILYKYKPSEIRMIMIDPKMVELGVYNGIPHLLIPVVTDPKKAAASLNWAVMEMTQRYEKFAEVHVRDLKGYNEHVKKEAAKPENKEDLAANPQNYEPMPKIVIIVDELADLMMVAPGDVENAIIRLSQLARAAGMHLVIATQRPSVNVITGLIKANMPSRIALAVTSSIDSRTILDQGGAEKLLGKGDMLFAPMNLPKPIRVQGASVSDGEVEKVVEFIKGENSGAVYNDEITSKINQITVSSGKGGGQTTAGSDSSDAQGGDGLDEYLVEAGRLIIDKQKASIGMLQRVYRIGFNRAARIVDQLSDYGVLGPENGTKSREILMTKEQFEEYVQNNL